MIAHVRITLPGPTATCHHCNAAKTIDQPTKIDFDREVASFADFHKKCKKHTATCGCPAKPARGATVEQATIVGTQK